MTDRTRSEKVVELAKRRGFFSQTAEVYGGVAGFYTYGPEGAELKRNIENLWRERFNTKEGNREIEAPTIMPEPVFEASGHLDGFDDMILECESCGQSHRADHLVEDNTDIEEAESFSTEKIAEIIKENDIVCPSCGAPLADIEVEDFNLMFATSIGPGDSNPGYLRPETAQGIFTEFPRFKEYMRNQLPFGITQIGKAYRNEISPRKSIIRVREFTQAELEYFIDPEEDEPNLDKVSDVEVRLYSAEQQESGSGEIQEMTINEAVENDVITSDWVAYFLGISKKWYERIGIDMEKFRFRQHNSGELAHYASDCWDAEAYVSESWVEIAGFAFRGCYDLKKHMEHSGADFTIFKEFDETKEVEKTEINIDMSVLGPEYGDEAGKIAENLKRQIREDHDLADQEEIEIEVDEDRYSISTDIISVKTVKEEISGERITPQVVEPSFGIGRTVYSVLEHAYSEDKVEGEDRTVLKFTDVSAPNDVAVFPLMDKEGMDDKAREIADQLREKGFSVRYDESGSIGRRYRRQDEIGTPYCITVDHETMEDNTVTVRDRDSTEQERVEIEKIEGELSG